MNLDSDRIDRITANATARARLIQGQIDELRLDLLECPEALEPVKIAILTSLDTEMNRLCQIPGVAQALFDEESP